jgi:hypothetical protein
MTLGVQATHSGALTCHRHPPPPPTAGPATKVPQGPYRLTLLCQGLGFTCYPYGCVGNRDLDSRAGVSSNQDVFLLFRTEELK